MATADAKKEDEEQQPLPSSDEDFWAAVAAQQATEGFSACPWRQTGSPPATAGRGKGKSRGAAGAAVAAGVVCALCEDRSEGRWVTRCKGSGGGPTRQQQTCSIWVHPACAWQNEGYAMRCIAGASGGTDNETRLPTVFFACPLHDKTATYCSCKREEGEDEEGAEDYIECESCNEWYHFSCEGLDENDPPDVYSCKRCRQLTAKGQKVSAQERRRNKAKTNEYMSQMLANKVMQIQQWIKEVKTLADSGPAYTHTATAAASAEQKAAAQDRYATLKELLSRREELEAPLEDEEDAEANAGSRTKASKAKSKGGSSRGRGSSGGGGGGGGGGSVDENKVVHGMEGVYVIASEELERVEQESDAVEMAVDTWFDDHPESYYKKSDGGGRLGYWNTSAAILEGEVTALEALLSSAQSARAGPPSAVAAAEDALAAARWALKAFHLFNSVGGGSGTAGSGAGGEGDGSWGKRRLPALAAVSSLLETAEEAMTTSADRRGRANTAWQHVNDIRSMSSQWIRRAKTCLRADGAAAGVTLAVMRRHLSSGDAVPVSMPEFRELERVASEWEEWESRAFTCSASLEAVPLEELAGTTTISGETDAEASELLQEADGFVHGVKTNARDALTRALGRRGWAQRAAAVVSSSGVGIARPGVALTQSLMTEAGKLGLLKGTDGGSAPLIASVRALAEGEGPAKRAREFLDTAEAGVDGGLNENSGDSELCEAEGVLDGLRSSPVVYPEEEALALRLDALRWNESASKGLAEIIPHQQLLHLHEQITTSEQLESVVEGFKSCMPLYTKVSKVKRWQERARKLLVAVRATASASAAPATTGGAPKMGDAVGSLWRRVEASLSELELDLKVSGVPEAVELTGLLQGASAWEAGVARFAGSASEPSWEEALRLAAAGEGVMSSPQMVQALRWRAECLQEASEGGANPVDTDKVAALLAAGDVLSVWSKTPVGGEGGVAAGSGEGDPPRQGRLVGQIVAAGLGDLGWHSWRARASRAANLPPPPAGSSLSPAAANAIKTTLAEAHALLDAVFAGGSALGDGGGVAAVPALEGDALSLAAASTELVELRGAVAAKDAAVALAWGGRRGGGSGGSGGGWGSAFAVPPPTTWQVASDLGKAGQQFAGPVLSQWKNWRGSMSGLVEGMEGVLAGVVGAAPSLRSALESHLETRIKAARWLFVVGGILLSTASGGGGGRIRPPTFTLLESLVATAPPATPSYKPGDDSIASHPAEAAAAAAERGNGVDDVVQGQQATIVADMLARMMELRAAAAAWGQEARVALAARERALQSGGAGAGSDVGAIVALLARDVQNAVQMPEEEALKEALKAQGQWMPQAMALIAAPMAQAASAIDTGTWLPAARSLLQEAPATMPPGSPHVAILRWTIAVGEMADVVRVAAASANNNRPKLANMEPLADSGRGLLLSSTSATGGATAAGSATVALLSAAGIAAPVGIIPAAASAQPFFLRLSDGPLSAISAIEAVIRGVDSCRRWVEGAKALTSERGLDGAPAARLVEELQANRRLPYAVGGGLRTTLAHELSLKAPENPELAHHLGSTMGDEDDEMAGALDINDMDWGSISDPDGGALLPAALDTIAVSPVKNQRHTGGGGGSGASTGSSGALRGAPRNGAAHGSSQAAAPAPAPAPARVTPPPLFTATGAAISTRGSRNQRTSPFNLKACSACKKGRASAIKCRVDRRHWEDPDWTDPPSRPWVMPAGFVEWLAKEDPGPEGQKPGSPVNAATAAAAAVAAAAMVTVGRAPGPRPARVESASSLLDRMLGSAALPAPPPAPVPRAPIPAARVAPGAPVTGGAGLKRTRCMTQGCTTAVAREAAFCSDDCLVAAQKQAAQALVVYRGKLGGPVAAAAAAQNNGGAAGASAGAEDDAAAAAGGSAGGDAATGGASGGAGTGGGASSKAVAGTGPATPKWTAEDEESFAKGLEAVRAKSIHNSTQRFRNKVMDRFRELFAEGMAELGVDDVDVTMFSGVLAWDLEHELNACSRSERGVYKEKAQSLRFNIKFAKNPELFKDLVTGGTSMKALCGMSTDELASSNLKEERKRIRDESYAGHLRQEDEGNEIVYKDGALQKIAKVKSDATKQVVAATSASAATATPGKAKKTRGGGAPGGSPSGGGGPGSTVKIEGTESIRGKAPPGGDKTGRGSGGEDEEDEEEEGEVSLLAGSGRRGSGGGAGGGLELKRRLSSSSDVGGDGDGGGEGSSKRMRRLSAGSPIIEDVPKLEFPSSPLPLPDFPSSPTLEFSSTGLERVPSPPGAEDDSDDGVELRLMDVDADDSDGQGSTGRGGDDADYELRDASGNRNNGHSAARARRGDDNEGRDNGNGGGLGESRFSVDDTDMDVEENSEEGTPPPSASLSKPLGSQSSGVAGAGGGASGSGGSKSVPPPPEVEGMTHIAPKVGRGGRAARSENFAVNEPGREPFYVHAYFTGIPEHCADLQSLLPRNLDVDGRVTIANLNGTMKARAPGSVKVLSLRPGGGGPNNPNVCNRFCNDFATYKNQGRAGYCFKQFKLFDKKHVEFLYLVPPALAYQVPLLAQTPAASGYLACLVVTAQLPGREPGVPAQAAPPGPVATPPPVAAGTPASAPVAPPPPPPQQYLYHPAPPTFQPAVAPSSPAQPPVQPPPPPLHQQQAAPLGPPPLAVPLGGSVLPPPPPPPPPPPQMSAPPGVPPVVVWNPPPQVEQGMVPSPVPSPPLHAVVAPTGALPLPPPPPPPPPPVGSAAFGGGGSGGQAFQAPPPPPQQQQQQQHPLALPIAERIATMGPQELDAMRRLPDAQVQYPFIFEGHPGFEPFRAMLAGLVMPRLHQG